MKKVLLSLVMVMALLISFTSCKGEKKDTETTEVEVTETVEVEVTETEDMDATEATEATEVETTTTEGDAEAPAKDVLDEESVTVTYARMINGMEVKAKKTFKGSQEEVEALVKTFEDSLKKLDPNIKITNK